MKAPLLNPSFIYHNAEESRKPGYLSKRFTAYRKKLAKEQEQTEQKVTRLRAGK